MRTPLCREAEGGNSTAPAEQRPAAHAGGKPQRRSNGAAPPESAPSNGSAAPAAPFKVMGLDATPELAAIFLVYFVQGILGLSRLAVSYYFKDDLGMDPAELAVFTGFTTFPWLIKPLYGFLSDTFPLFGYKRRSYLAACGVLGSSAWAAMWLTHPEAYLATAFLVLGSAGVACSDVVVDSIVVEASRGQPGSVAGAPRRGQLWPPPGCAVAACMRRARPSVLFCAFPSLSTASRALPAAFAGDAQHHGCMKHRVLVCSGDDVSCTAEHVHVSTCLRHSAGAGSYQSLSWGASSIGGIVSAYFSGQLIEQYGVSFVFAVTAVFPLLVLAAALLITEQRTAPPTKDSAGRSLGSSAAVLRAEAAGQVRVWKAPSLWDGLLTMHRV